MKIILYFKKNILWVGAVFVLFSYFSCSSVPAGVILWEGELTDGEGKKTPRWELAVNEKNQASLTLPYSDSTLITGEAFAGSDGSWTFHMDYLEWFGNWHKGWTEARFSLVGSVKLLPRGDFWDLTVLEVPVIGAVLEGEVRYKEDKFYGDRSRDMVSRRWTRIQAAAPFIRETLNPAAYTFGDKKAGYDSRSFRKDLEQLLFPEVAGYSPAHPEPAIGEKVPDRFERGEGIWWDTLYSGNFIPEELRAVRNSGTLYRDYEEASRLFLLAITWPRLWEEVIPLSTITLRSEL